MKKESTILVCLLLLILSTVQSDDFPFQKKLWSFWDAEDFTSAPMLAQVCHYKIKQAADKAGFEYILLNANNARQYITNYDDNILKVREHSYQQGKQFLADLIRFHVIHEQGGIWMDITEVLIDDFEWLLNLKDTKYQHIITNRFSQEPDVLLFYFPLYQNSAQYMITSPNNNNKLIRYNEFPGYEVWFLAAKKNSSLMGEIKQTYKRFTQTDYPQLFRQFIQEEIYMQSQDGIGYLSGNYAISYVLQRRQRQLDRNVQLFGNRVTVYEYYNLWSLSALLGPLTWVNDQLAHFIHFIDQPRKFFQDRGWIMIFFVKIVGQLTKTFTQKLQLLKPIFQQKTFEQFLQSKPSQKSCREIYFLVDGSFLQQLFKNTTYLSQQGIKTISQSQNQQWYSYCLDKYSINKESSSSYLIQKVWDSLMFLGGRAVVPWYKAHQTVNFDKDYKGDTMGRIGDWFFQKSAMIGYWVKFSVDSTIWYVLQLSICIYVCGKFITGGGMSEDNVRLRPASNDYIESSSLTKTFSSQQSISGSSIFLSFLIILLNTLCLFEYYMSDYFGLRDRPQETLYAVAVVFLLQQFIQKRVKSSKYIQLCYEVIYPFISFRITYLVLNMLRMNKNRLTFYAYMLGMLAPCLIKLLNRISAIHEIENPLLKIVHTYVNKNFHRKALFFFLLFIQIVPNFRYVVVNDNYLVGYLPVVVFWGVVAVYCSLLLVVVRQGCWMETLRVLMVGSFSLTVFFMLPYRNQHVEHNFHRMLWTALTTALYQTFYVQIGNEYLKPNYSTFSLRSFQKHRKELIICFALFFVEITVGSFTWLPRIPFWDRQVYFEGLLIGIGNYFIALYLHVEVENSQKRQISKQQGGKHGFEEIEFSQAQ